MVKCISLCLFNALISMFWVFNLIFFIVLHTFFPINQKLYSTVIEEVINGVRDLFLDEGVDEQVLQELKQTWERKLLESKAIDYSDKYSEIGSSSLSANNRLSNQGSNSSTRTSNSSRNTNATRDVNQQASK